MRTRRRLGDLLVDGDLLTPEQLEELLEARMTRGGRIERLGEAAVRLGFCSPDDIGMVLAQQLGLEYMEGPSLPVDESVARDIPVALADRHKVIPMWREDDEVVVACTDPTNIVGLDDVRVALGARRLQIVVAPTIAVRQAITDAYGAEARARTGDLLSSLDAEEPEAEVDDEAMATANDGPIIKLADDLVTRALRAEASDVHVEPRADSVVVRHRRDGVLHDAMTLPRAVAGPLVSRLKLMAGLDIAERRKPQDGRATVRAGSAVGDTVDLRMSTLPTTFGESVVIRLLRRDEARLTPEDIGMDASQSAQVIGTIERPQGLVLVTGPTGSGKTSTLYTLLQHLSTSERKLVTVEDPVEYELPGVVQTQVNDRAGYTVARALRTMLRQDPDVLMVGEIRDPETAELALHASLTGHLVLATLHTNDAPTAVVRLSELGMPSYLIASALTMVIAQRLVRKVCSGCATPAPATDRHRQRLALPRTDGFARGAGCPACDHAGYRGRSGVFEILTVNGAVREQIADGAGTAAVTQAARAAGMRGLREDALAKALDGITSLDEVLRVTPRSTHDVDTCPMCAKQIEQDFQRCPWCTADLRPFRCEDCERPMDPAWTICPSCGTAPQGAEEAGAPALPTVLVVDDDERVQETLTAMLTGDYEVLCAGDATTALSMLHANRVAAMIVDKGLPDMDGYALTREVRARPAVRDLPIMVITGYDDPQVEMEGLRAGADDWLAKPVDLEVLIARLGRLLSRKAIHAA